MPCLRSPRLKGREPGRRRQPGSQLGKLRSFAAGSGAELGERLTCGIVGLGFITVVPRCSPLDLVRLWCGRHLGMHCQSSY